MKILYAASEATPFAKSGGLADVAGALPKALVKDGIDAIKSALDDVAQAGRVIGKFDLAEKHAEEAAAEGEGDDTVVIDASELGEPPAKKPKH